MHKTRNQLMASSILLAMAGLCGWAWAITAAAQAGAAGPTRSPAAAASARADVPMQPPTAQAGSGPARPWSYRCDGGLEFNVRFGDGAATVDAAPGGSQVLLRDAGGATPQQTVYSNERMRVEFGLGETGREAIVREAGATDGVHCIAQ
ncbi:MAG: hypothetical protein ACXWJM_03395 [Ramlibacter sp.]